MVDKSKVKFSLLCFTLQIASGGGMTCLYSIFWKVKKQLSGPLAARVVLSPARLPGARCASVVLEGEYRDLARDICRGPSNQLFLSEKGL
ncbi:hypothetical protein ACFX11_040939 [Malus domestica]